MAIKINKTIEIVILVGLVMFLLGRVIGHYSSPTKKIEKINDRRETITKELFEAEKERMRLMHNIDSLRWENMYKQKEIDSLNFLIEISQKSYKNETSRIRYWSDAKRDSFWRVESSRNP